MTAAATRPAAATRHAGQLCLPLRERDALLAAGALDAGAWRAALVDSVTAGDPAIRAFADWRAADVDDPRVPAQPTVAYKDTIDVAGHPTRLGIAAGYRHYPARSARVVEELTAAGYVFAGKTATTEVSIGTRIPTRNPRHPGVSAGGSSCGAGAAVAAGWCDLGVGTDSGGSIRWPAVYCGVVGLRLTRDPAQLAGVLPVSPGMESLGLVTRTVDDLHHLWHHRRLASLVGRRAEVPRPRFGALADMDELPLHPEVRAALCAVLGWLATPQQPVRRVSPPWWSARAAAWDLLLREAADVHADRDTDEYDPGTRAALELGRRVDDAALAALRRRRASAVFGDDVDVVVLPLDPELADRPPDPERASTVPTGDPGFTIAASFAGLPVLALPVAYAADGSPLGVQLVARPYHEDLLIDVGRRLEQQARREVAA